MAKRKFTADAIAACRTSLNEGRVTDLPLELVVPDQGQPRRTFGDDSLQALADDIARNGVLQPITVDHTDDGWQIVMGERRWRAAGIAGLKTIPALLATSRVADAADASQWQLERRLQQFAENHHREPLPPMDLAWFLRGLRDDLGLSATAISTSLKERGVREMGRSYVSNTIRLTELPKGYQQLIADGDLAPSNGKYLLMAMGLGDKGLAALDAELEAERQNLREGDRLTLEDVQNAVASVFAEHAAPLDGASWHMRAVADALLDEGLPYVDQIVFDVGQCKSCPKRQPFTTAFGQQQVWCLDRLAFLEKQRAALKAIAAGEASAPEGVEVEMDLSTGPDAPGEGVMPPGPGYVTPEQREESLRSRVHDHLVEWLRPRLTAAFAAAPIEASVGFVLWAALGFPLASKNWQEQPYVELAQSWQMKFDTKALALELVMADPLQVGRSRIDLERCVRDYVAAAVGALDATRVWRCAIAVGVGLEGYNITQGYFECCDKHEVEILARELGVHTTSSATKGKVVAAIAKAAPDHVPTRATAVFEESTAAHQHAVLAWAEQMRAQDAAFVGGDEDNDQQAAA